MSVELQGITSLAHICVCICTFKRPALLAKTLEAVAGQETKGLFSYSVVVVDNDSGESARSAVAAFAGRAPVPVRYEVEPTQNIAMARNRAVAAARGDYLAFVDDDEIPEPSWLFTMISACESHEVDGVLGPVMPRFEVPPPEWVVKGGFYDRARHETGFKMGWREARTGNVLLRRSALSGLSEVFRPRFGTGGEDQDFFRRMMAQGKRFVWCDEAPLYEVVPPHRWSRTFLIKRALLRGKTTKEHRENLWVNLGKSLVAVPLYFLALPVLFLAGHHLGMRYLVRLCDHGGRLLAMVDLNPVRERCH